MILQNFTRSTPWVIFLSYSWHDCQRGTIYIDVLIYVYIYTHTPQYKKDSWWDPQQYRLGDYDVFPNIPSTSHTHWKCWLLVAITVITQFSDLSFMYTHSMIFSFPQWKKKKYKSKNYLSTVYLVFLLWTLTSSFQIPETFLRYPMCMWMSAAETGRKTHMAELWKK